ncbi:MAG: TldD/PmbA family protein [Actinobacteria bacterium]|nr:TldD/PmbA family protein [Actinomycetota bacterium]MCL5446778.1 TldD/PmbA family protein [Actinomycetota bacterium]
MEGDLLDIAKRVAGMAQRGEQVEAYVSRNVSTEVRAYNGELEHLVSASSDGVGIRVIAGERQGFAYTGYLSDDSIAVTLAQARENAVFATADASVSMAEPDGIAAVEMDLLDSGLDSVSTEAKVDLALELERSARHGHRQIRQVDSADYADVISQEAVANSEGIAAYSEHSYCEVSVSVIAGEGSQSQSGSGFSVARGFDGLDLEKAAGDAVHRAVRLLGAGKPATAGYTVVFDPRVTATLLSVVSTALSGEAVTKGRSFLAGRVGEQVMVAGALVVDDPTDARALSADSYDAEGLASRRIVLVEDGRLLGYVYDSTSGARAGHASTGSAVRSGFASTPVAACRAVVLSAGGSSGTDGNVQVSNSGPGGVASGGVARGDHFGAVTSARNSGTVGGDLGDRKPGQNGTSGYGAGEIISAVGDGVYVQSVTGMHSGVNPVSGDFSVGVEGLMIRGGELAEPIREATVASTLQRMLLSIVGIGSDVEWLPANAAGQTIAISGMMLSGN